MSVSDFQPGDGPLWVVGISGKIGTAKTLLSWALAQGVLHPDDPLDTPPGDVAGVVELNFGDLLKNFFFISLG